jgi:hypothetical protein
MSSLFFIFIHSVLNTVKRFLKKPVNLIMAIFLLGFIVLTMLAPSLDTDLAEDIQPMWIFKVGIFAYLAMFFIGSLAQGFKNGSSMFDMCDINLAFTAPIKQQSVLIYGMIKSLGRALLICVFIIWQGALFAIFGIDFRGILLTIALVVIVIALCQFLQMAIYLLTFGRKKRKIAIGIGVAALYLPLIGKAIYEFTTESDLSVAAERVVNSPFFDYSPILGWMSGAAAQFAKELSFVPNTSGNILQGFILLGLLLAAFAGCALFIIRSKADFYEDAIVAGETRFAKQRDIAEGNINSIYSTANKSVPKKLKKTGVSGFGASALFHRQMRETFRGKFFGFLDASTITQIAMVVGFTIAIKGGGDDGGLSPIMDMLLILALLSVCQIFMLSLGSGMRELFSHYIYMIPESPFKKLVWANIASLFKAACEAVVIFVGVGIVFGAPVMVIVTCFIAYVAYVFYLIGLTFAFERIEVGSKGLALILYFSAVFTLLGPGIIAAALLGSLLGAPLGLLVLTGWEILAGVGLFALAQGVLHNMDIPQLTTAGISLKTE